MKKAETLLSEMYGTKPSYNIKQVINLMNEFARQLETKPCACIQQEKDLKNIERNDYSNNG